jgi:hypothetical protein
MNNGGYMSFMRKHIESLISGNICSDRAGSLDYFLAVHLILTGVDQDVLQGYTRQSCHESFFGNDQIPGTGKIDYFLPKF